MSASDCERAHPQSRLRTHTSGLCALLVWAPSLPVQSELTRISSCARGAQLSRARGAPRGTARPDPSPPARFPSLRLDGALRQRSPLRTSTPRRDGSHTLGREDYGPPPALDARWRRASRHRSRFLAPHGALCRKAQRLSVDSDVRRVGAAARRSCHERAAKTAQRRGRLRRAPSPVDS